MEHTLAVLKPDAVERGLCGRILQRFEDAGLKIVAAKIFTPARELIDRHYPKTAAYIESLGNKSLKNYAELGLDAMKLIGSDNAADIGAKVREWLIDYISRGRVFAMVAEGNDAIRQVRKLVGPTFPSDAPPGTIRGDFSVESSFSANNAGRAITNLIHASGNPEEAKYEIELWFGKNYG
ncbi:MAG: hypothetical protein LBH41_00170 [Rickettsiales bacterium]|jgi:nucleoside-diphosphate kinase|nr:hypothetical protein [Rickettsiales bacterium]